MMHMLSNRKLLFALVFGASAGVLWLYKNRSRNSIMSLQKLDSSLVSELANSNTKTLGDMVEQLVKLGVITDTRVSYAMLCVDRAKYVPQHSTDNPYREAAAPIGFNATISAPHMHAIGLSLLCEKLHDGARVLDVGSGSGYMSACLATLVGNSGHVYGVEHISELVEQSKISIANANSDLLPKIHLTAGDGFAGLPEHAPFDAIYVGAAAEYIPDELVKQLKYGGRMVIPVGPAGGFHSLVVVDVGADGAVSTKNLGVVRFVPLTSYEKQIDGEASGPTRIIKGADGKPVLVRSQYFPAPDTTSADIKIIRHQLASARQ
jgi:protein-L-isoaspartate(D-aspartate) O-methyltransferase